MTPLADLLGAGVRAAPPCLARGSFEGLTTSLSHVKGGFLGAARAQASLSLSSVLSAAGHSPTLAGASGRVKAWAQTAARGLLPLPTALGIFRCDDTALSACLTSPVVSVANLPSRGCSSGPQRSPHVLGRDLRAPDGCDAVWIHDCLGKDRNSGLGFARAALKQPGGGKCPSGWVQWMTKAHTSPSQDNGWQTTGSVSGITPKAGKSGKRVKGKAAETTSHAGQRRRL